MKKPYMVVSKQQAKVIVSAHNAELPLVDNHTAKLECGAVLRRLPVICRKGGDKAHAFAYRISADTPEILQPILSLVGSIGRPVCLRYETDRDEFRKNLELVKQRDLTTTYPVLN